jgi:3',5'-nucleoside bisphosphate phosphatase
MKTFRAELHTHTVLSPCAGVEMIPPLIVQEALDNGINLLAITDHNASANIEAVMQAAAGTGLTILPGMELQTHEEVHLLCLFDTIEQIQQWQAVVDQCLPNIQNKPDFFGEQFVVDATGDFIRHENRLLSNSADISLEDAAEGVKKLGGLPIPAHVDRKAYGLLATLGLIPPGFEALEISRYINVTEALRTFPQITGYPLLQSGDVHYMDGFLGAVLFEMEKPTIAEIRMALRSETSRHFCLKGENG